jgi:hypothetical protein
MIARLGQTKENANDQDIQGRAAALVCVVVTTAVFVSTPGEAQSNEFEHQIVGNWKYGPPTQKEKPTIEQAKGYITLTNKGRWIELANDDGQSPGVGAWSSYSGTYTVEGNKVTIKIDVATNPALVGTVRTRYLSVKDKELTIMTSPDAKMPDAKAADLRAVTPLKVARPC